MSTRLLLIIAGLFFVSWRRTADGFLLFGALFAAGLFVCQCLRQSDLPRAGAEEKTS